MTETRDPGADSLTGRWQLDPTATTVRLRTKAMWGMATVNGTMQALEGSGTVGNDGSVSGTLVIDAASIDTAQGKRDNHLRSEDFFDVERYPTFVYTVTSATVDGSGTVAIAGTFTAHGQTHPLPVRGILTAVAPSSITVTVEADLNRAQWGMGWTKMGARLDNHITVGAVFIRS